MQFSIVTLLVAATGALAAPGRGGRPDRPSGDRNTNTQTVSCSGGSAYCCSPEYTEGGLLSNYKCDKNTNSCNIAGNTIVCCSQNVQGNNNRQSQYCSAFGNQKVIFV